MNIYQIAYLGSLFLALNIPFYFADQQIISNKFIFFLLQILVVFDVVVVVYFIIWVLWRFFLLLGDAE